MDTRKHFSKLGLVLLLGTVLVYVVQLIATAILRALTEGTALANNMDLRFLVIMLPVYFIAYPVLYIMLRKIPAPESTEKKMGFWKMVAAFLICYAGMYLTNMLGILTTTLIGYLKQSEVSNVMVEITGSVSLWATFPVMIIMAPLAEELIFRKALIDRVAPYGEGIAVLLSALLFSLFHGNLNQFAYTFFLGGFFGFLYVKTKRVRYTILLHMVVNFMGSFLGVLIGNLSGYTKIARATQQGITQAQLNQLMWEHRYGLMLYSGYSYLLLFFVIAGLILFFINIKKFRLHAGEQTIEKGRKFATVFCNIGMGLFCLFWIAMTVIQLFR